MAYWVEKVSYVAHHKLDIQDNLPRKHTASNSAMLFKSVIPGTTVTVRYF